MKKPTRPKVRQFKTGATRDRDENKLNYTGFDNPFVQKRYAEFMHRNRVPSDGAVRAADNWQKGIPRQAYMESLERHFMEVKLMHESLRPGKRLRMSVDEEQLLDNLMAIVFNAKGMALEIMKGTEVEAA